MLFRQENTVALEKGFRNFVELCVKPGLCGKGLAATGGNKSRTVNRKERNFTLEKLRDRITRLEGRIGEYLKELEENDGKKESTEWGEKSAEEMKNPGASSWVLRWIGNLLYWRSPYPNAKIV
jgi:hypothetical protein